MNYKSIQTHYEKALEANLGNPTLEVDWDNERNAELRYKYFLDFALSRHHHTLLDFGAGTGTMYSKLHSWEKNLYTGLDISSKMIEEAQRRYPDGKFICQDILTQPLDKNYDIILANGTWTEKRDLSYVEMALFVQRCLEELWKHTNIGLAFNLMDANRIKTEDQRKELFFMEYSDIMWMLVGQLKPSKWKIENIGMYDTMVCLWK